MQSPKGTQKYCFKQNNSKTYSLMIKKLLRVQLKKKKKKYLQAEKKKSKCNLRCEAYGVLIISIQ